MPLKQSPNHPGLVSRFLHGHQVLNSTEGYHPLDPILWASILEDRKLSGVLGASSWVVCIHEEKLQLGSFILVRIRSINLVHLLLHLGNKRNGRGGVSRIEEGKAAAVFENLLMAIVWIEILQQKCDHSALY
jgi:hypothetical protein